MFTWWRGERAPRSTSVLVPQEYSRLIFNNVGRRSVKPVLAETPARCLFAMNDTSPSLCVVPVYLALCASSKVLLLVPGLVLNVLIVASVLACVLGRRGKIRGNVATFVLGSTGCNLLSLGLWPLTIHWGHCGRWLLGAGPCELMVSARHLSGTASFYYVSLIGFSLYLTVVCDCGRLASNRLFHALQLLFPLVHVGAAELGLWLGGDHARHLDPVALTCFSFINDRAARGLALANTAVLLPSNLYFYGHILYSVTRSGRLIHRSRKVSCRLATVFSLISLITLASHIPGE